MKYGQFFSAYEVLQKINDMQFQVRDAYRIYKLLKELEPAFQFGIQREQEMIERYDGRPQSDGSVRFVHGDDEESRKKGLANMESFQREMEELTNMEVEGEFEAISMSLDALGDQTLTPREIALLDGMIHFE